jgi:hypothetical protein
MPFHILGTMPINMDNIEYISSSESDFDSNSESRVMPITELAIQRPQRRRLGINSIFYHRPVAQALYEKWSTETAVMFASASAANGGSKPKPPRKLQVRSQSSSSDASPTPPLQRTTSSRTNLLTTFPYLPSAITTCALTACSILKSEPDSIHACQHDVEKLPRASGLYTYE